MSLTQNVFDKNWASIAREAAMLRVQGPPENVETVSVPKVLFDDLLLVAQTAAKAQNSGGQPAEMTITY
jgi:hypothetical protein